MSLPSRYREAVILCDLHDLSYAEAAAVLGSPAVQSGRGCIARGVCSRSGFTRANPAAGATSPARSRGASMREETRDSATADVEWVLRDLAADDRDPRVPPHVHRAVIRRGTPR